MRTELEQAICEAYQTRMTIREICAEFKIGQKRLSAIIEANGLPLRKRKIISDETKELVKADYLAGMKICEMSEKYDLNTSSISSICENLPKRRAEANKTELMDKAQELRYKGHSVREIAEMLNVRPGTIENYTTSGVVNFKPKGMGINEFNIARRLAVPRMPV